MLVVPFWGVLRRKMTHLEQLGSNNRDNTNSQELAEINSPSAYDWQGFVMMVILISVRAAKMPAATATVEMAGNVRCHFLSV